MPDRLADLRHQRRLVQQQLEWIDREIAALDADAPPAPGAAPVKPASSGDALVPAWGQPRTEPIPAARPPSRRPFPDLSEYQADPKSIQNDARRGCLLYTAIAFVVLAAVLVAIYFFAYRDRPLLFISDKPAPTAPPPK